MAARRARSSSGPPARPTTAKEGAGRGTPSAAAAAVEVKVTAALAERQLRAAAERIGRGAFASQSSRASPEKTMERASAEYEAAPSSAAGG